MADKNYYGNHEHIKVTPGITVTYNYIRLKNKPTINGKPLDGKITASDLNLLSNNVTEYEEIKLGVDKRDSFILVVGGKSFCLKSMTRLLSLPIPPTTIAWATPSSGIMS